MSDADAETRPGPPAGRPRDADADASPTDAPPTDAPPTGASTADVASGAPETAAPGPSPEPPAEPPAGEPPGVSHDTPHDTPHDIPTDAQPDTASGDTGPARVEVPPGPLEPEPPLPDGAVLLRVALGFYAIVSLFAFGYALFSGGLGTLFGERLPELPGLLAGLGLGIALVLLSRVGARAWPPMRRMSETLGDLLGPLTWQHAVVLACLSGFAEELLFRGALWPHLGLVGTTLLFGLVHVLPRRALWIYPLFAVLAGLLFGLLREGTQSLWPCVLAHVTVNGLNLVWIGRLATERHASKG